MAAAVIKTKELSEAIEKLEDVLRMYLDDAKTENKMED